MKLLQKFQTSSLGNPQIQRYFHITFLFGPAQIKHRPHTERLVTVYYNSHLESPQIKCAQTVTGFWLEKVTAEKTDSIIS